MFISLLPLESVFSAVFVRAQTRAFINVLTTEETSSIGPIHSLAVAATIKEFPHLFGPTEKCFQGQRVLLFGVVPES